MIKLFLIGLSCVLLFLSEIKSFEIDEYVASIDELLINKQFIKAYAKWSFKLFSDPDYLYGKEIGAFPCEIPSKEGENAPITVHNLRPIDVECIGAIGDSLTAGLGAQAATPIGLFTENRC
jgi:hypothetical protein